MSRRFGLQQDCAFAEGHARVGSSKDSAVAWDAYAHQLICSIGSTIIFSSNIVLRPQRFYFLIQQLLPFASRFIYTFHSVALRFYRMTAAHPVKTAL